jgi:uncharacterized protein involved in exopolysaccharide biosynthesis
MDKSLEQRVEALEKEVAALKEQVSKLPENVEPPKIGDFMEIERKLNVEHVRIVED